MEGRVVQETRHGTIRFDEKSLWVGEHRLQLVSGAIHYFRIAPEEWQERLIACRDGGLNTIETVVPWNVHEFDEGTLRWDGMRDLPKFLDIAWELGLYAIVRPGPYICGEWDGGGFPWWLGSKPGIAFRRSNPVYLYYAQRWLKAIWELLQPYQWPNGPIILVQLENEYGYFGDAQDRSYMTWLRDTAQEAGMTIPLMTSDAPGSGFTLPGVLKGANFGSHFRNGLTVQHSEQPQAFALVSELWLAWFDQWGGAHQTRPAQDVAYALKEVLAEGGQYNVYMWAGGTNFGYTAGRTTGGEYGAFITTSYDYDAAIGETGVRTDKYYACRLVNWFVQSFEEVFVNADVERQLMWGPTDKDVQYTARRADQGTLWFLSNPSENPKSFAMHRIGGAVSFPTRTRIRLEPGETKILLNQYRLSVRTMLEHITAEVLVITEGPDQTPRLVAYGESRSTVEIAYRSEGESRMVTCTVPDGDDPLITAVGDSEVAVYRTETAKRLNIVKHGRGYHVSGPVTTPTSETTLPRFTEWMGMDPRQQLDQRAGRDIGIVGSVTPTTLPSGYHWYRTSVSHPGGPDYLVFTAIHDRAAVYVNGVYQGIVGSFASFALVPVDFAPGCNQVDVLLDALGGYSFTARVGECKGLRGPVFIGGASKPLEPWQRSKDGTTWNVLLPWHLGEGLLVRMTELDGPITVAVGDVVIYQHRSITDDDTFVELDLTPYLRYRQNLSVTRTDGNILERAPRIQAVAYQATRVLAGPWRVYSGVVGESSDIEAESAVFSSLSWEPISPLMESHDRPWLYRTFFTVADPGRVRQWKLVMEGMSKGVVWLNGKHLGRFWSLDPQMSLYVPGSWVQLDNEMIVFDEFGKSPSAVHWTTSSTAR